MADKGRSASVAVWVLLLVSTALAGLIAVAPSARAGCAVSPSPCIDIVTPNGGEDLTGGVSQDLQFYLDRGVDTDPVIWLLLEYRSGPLAPWSVLFNLTSPSLAELFNTRSFNLPANDTTTAELRLSIRVGGVIPGTDVDVTDATFTVDSTMPILSWDLPMSPSLEVFCPNCSGDQNLTFGPTAFDLSFTISEPVDRASLEQGTRLVVDIVDFETTTVLSSYFLPSSSLFFNWAANSSAVRISAMVNLENGALLMLEIDTTPGTGFTDDSVPGNRGINDAGCLDDVWVFLGVCLADVAAGYYTEPANNPPTASVPAPAGGEVWSGGATVPVDFTVADERRDPFRDQPTQVWVNYTPAVGNGTIFSGLLWNGAYTVDWTVPAVSFPAYRVTLTATDAGALVTGVPRTRVVTTPPFAIDATPPYVLSMSIPNLAQGVGLREPLEVTFSEAMDEAAVEAAYSVTPIAPTSYSWINASRTMRIDHVLAPLTTYAWGFDCGLTDLSAPGNPLQPCLTYAFTSQNAPPAVTITGPAVGGTWSGGKARPVTWTMSDANTATPALRAELEYSLDYVAWTPAAIGTGMLSAPLTAPCVDGSLLVLRVTVYDEQGLPGNTTREGFTIDCVAPTVVATVPADVAGGIDPAADITITFSEPMAPSTLADCVRLLPNPGGLSVTVSPDGLTATIAHPVLRPAQEYTVVVCAGASDTSLPGLELGGHSFRFTTLVPPNAAPTVDLGLDAPAVPSPGAMITLRWEASDLEDARLQTVVELLPGMTVITQGLYANGPQTLSWRLQPVDGAVTFRVCVTDSGGASACDQETLAVDGRRPTLIVSPADGETGVDTEAPIRITFSEPMAAVALAVAVRLVPEAPGLTATWVDASTVELLHGGLVPGTTYTLRLGCSLIDTATPGNLLEGCAVVTTFTVTPPDLPPTVTFLEPAAGTLLDPGTVRVRWSAADDLDLSLAYTLVWRNATATAAIDAGTMSVEASALWSVPATLAGDVALEACVQDSAGQSACDTLLLAIERTPPPPTPVEQGELLVTGAGLTVTFPGTVPPSNVSAILIGGVGTPEYTWTYENGQTTLEISTEDLEACADHTLTLLDSLGLLAWQRTFRTPCGPAVTVDVPAEGMLRGGAIVLVAWNVTHEQATPLTLYLNYSVIGGLDGFPALVFTETMAPGENGLSWKVPSIDTLQLVLRLTAVDAAGRSGWNVTRLLQVDSTPPVPFIYRDGDLVTGAPVRFDGSASFDSVSSIARHRWRLWTTSGGILSQSGATEFNHTFSLQGEHLVTLEVWDAAGNVAAVTQRLLVGAPGGAGEITVVTVAGGSLVGLVALGGTTVAASERARDWMFKTFFLPLYVRMRPDQVTNQETRGMIRGYIMVHPGDSYTQIKRNLKLGTGTLTYHLDVLEREKIIRSQSRGARKLYFPADVAMPEDGGGLHEIQLRILKVAEEQPGLTVRDLAGVLGGVSGELVRYHVRGLQMMGRIHAERSGLTLRVYRQRDGLVLRKVEAPAEDT